MSREDSSKGLAMPRCESDADAETPRAWGGQKCSIISPPFMSDLLPGLTETGQTPTTHPAIRAGPRGLLQTAQEFRIGVWHGLQLGREFRPSSFFCLLLLACSCLALLYFPAPCFYNFFFCSRTGVTWIVTCDWQVMNCSLHNKGANLTQRNFLSVNKYFSKYANTASLQRQDYPVLSSFVYLFLCLSSIFLYNKVFQCKPNRFTCSLFH